MGWPGGGAGCERGGGAGEAGCKVDGGAFGGRPRRGGCAGSIWASGGAWHGFNRRVEILSILLPILSLKKRGCAPARRKGRHRRVTGAADGRLFSPRRIKPGVDPLGGPLAQVWSGGMCQWGVCLPVLPENPQETTVKGFPANLGTGQVGVAGNRRRRQLVRRWSRLARPYVYPVVPRADVSSSLSLPPVPAGRL